LRTWVRSPPYLLQSSNQYYGTLARVKGGGEDKPGCCGGMALGCSKRGDNGT
jgi:hypothetical protein